jgi:hypothetical protein
MGDPPGLDGVRQSSVFKRPEDDVLALGVAQ